MVGAKGLGGEVVCFYLGPDVLAAARPWVAGEAPCHASWADPSPGGKAAGSQLAAPPHTHHTRLGSGLGVLKQRARHVLAASLSLPPEAWLLASVLQGASSGRQLRPTSPVK